MGFGRGALLWLLGIPCRSFCYWLCSGITDGCKNEATHQESRSERDFSFLGCGGPSEILRHLEMWAELTPDYSLADCSSAGPASKLHAGVAASVSSRPCG